MAASGSQCDSPRLSALMSIAPTLPEHSTGALWPPSDMLGHAMLVFDLLLLGACDPPKKRKPVATPMRGHRSSQHIHITTGGMRAGRSCLELGPDVAVRSLGRLTQPAGRPSTRPLTTPDEHKFDHAVMI